MKNRLHNSKFGVIFIIMLLGFLLAPRTSVALNFDFSGTVLYDSLASSSFRPGLGDNFNGSLSLSDDGSLSFYNNSSGTQYKEPGSVSSGQFTHNKIDYYYAYSQGTEQTPQMGLVWWSEPKQIKAQGNPYENNYISGLAFYLDGYNYTPAYLVAQSIREYIDKGKLSGLFSLNSNLRYKGCNVKLGNAFLGLITEPITQSTSTPAAVPIPAPFWLLGSGIALLWQTNKKWMWWHTH